MASATQTVRKKRNGKKTRNWQKIFFWIFVALTAITFLSFMIQATQCFFARRKMASDIKEKARKEVQRAAQEISSFMKTLKPLTETIANQLSTAAIPKEQVVERIKQKAINITGIGVAFAPNAYSKKLRLYAPYFVEKDGKQELIRLEQFYDYTGPTVPRFTVTSQKGAGFLNSFYDPASKTIVAEFAAPFYDLQRRFSGIVFANHSAEHIQHVLRTLKLGRSGYGFVISKNGSFVAHPETMYVRQQKTIFDIAKEQNDPILEKIGRDANTGKSGFVDHHNTLTGQDSWIFYEPIADTGWSIFGTFIKKEIGFATMSMRARMIRILLSMILFFMVTMLLLFRVYKGTNYHLWLASTITSVHLAGATLLMWYFAVTLFQYEQPKRKITEIYDHTTLTRFLEKVGTSQGSNGGKKEQSTGHAGHGTQKAETKSLHKHIDITFEPKALTLALAQQPKTGDMLKSTHTPTQKKTQKTTQIPAKVEQPQPAPTKATGHEQHGVQTPQNQAPKVGIKNKHIPTGVYIHHIDFVGVNKVRLIAHIWQRYHKVDHKNLKQGFFLPQADTISTDESYRFKNGQWETIGWSVKGLLHQDFAYDNYPFDQKDIRIQLWAQDFDKGILLVPDLAAYKVLNPTSLPGINKNLSIPSWILEKSFFSYETQRYLTNFGFYTVGPFGTIEQSTKSESPDLYFNITTGRSLLSSLILDLFPLIIVFIILFILLFMTARDIIHRFSAILGTTGSLFFTVILAHIQFKGNVSVQQIVFFEYFYFIAHFIVLFVSIMSILYFLKVQILIIRYRNMLIPQIIYWPMILGLAFLASFIFFY